LRELLQAHDDAQALGRDVWDFAVEAHALGAAGLTPTDVRRLLGRGYVAHGLERTRPGNTRRLFRRCANLALAAESCFVLTPQRVDLARQLLAPPARPARRPNMAPAPRADETPSWDAGRHTLFWRGRLIRCFKTEAPFQEAILTAFQAGGWACCVSVPLAEGSGVRSKGRLRDTIRNLNRGVGPHLRFRLEGSGSRVRWEPLAGAAGD
jgi:hypothetical protein